ncbi:DUF4383 domain-containing protein [Nocardia uniformis]|uniref:DUF4383 domain-containing protein n=1 Tax=Nocardia uniformis TaxID=53432 RepID=A0A849CIB3_9NOCA|nr:DUF4383 domain-containing protein [Nocardia uniformis]NNH75989.1 DUF4383 domain-containing protein [Nocardia uniformis]
MSAQTASERRIDLARWSFLQWAVAVVGIVHIVWAIVGFIVEPSFEVGQHAAATPVLGMDYNGWHAVGGLLLFVPALLAATRKSWAAWYCVIAAVGGGFVIGIWALFSEQVLIFSFPNHRTDAVIHIATGVLLLALIATQALRDGGLRRVFQ